MKQSVLSYIICIFNKLNHTKTDKNNKQNCYKNRKDLIKNVNKIFKLPRLTP